MVLSVPITRGFWLIAMHNDVSRSIPRLQLAAVVASVILASPVFCFADDVSLFEIVTSGDVEALLARINDGVDPNSSIDTPVGRLPLLKVAISDREEDIALLLLESGAEFELADVDLNTVSGKGLARVLAYLLSDDPRRLSEPSVLHAAAIAGYLEPVRISIAAAERTGYNWNEGDPVASALMVKHDDIARYLIEHGAIATPQQLALAARESSPGIVLLLMAHGLDPSAIILEYPNIQERTPVDFAWRRLAEDNRDPADIAKARFVLHELLNAGSKPIGVEVSIEELTAESRNGAARIRTATDNETQLELACGFGYLEIVESLLSSQEFEPSVKAKAARIALKARNDDIARLLIRRGVTIDDGILHAAIAYSSPGMVRYVLESGADPNLVHDGSTPLEVFLREGQAGEWSANKLHELLVRGADGCWLKKYSDMMPFNALARLKYSAPHCFREEVPDIVFIQ